MRLGPGYARDLSPDGKWAINIHQTKVRLLPRGAGVPRELDLGPIRSTHLINWHPDGQRLVVMGSEKGRPISIVAGTVLNTTTVVSDSTRPPGTKPSGGSQVAALA